MAAKPISETRPIGRVRHVL